MIQRALVALCLVSFAIHARADVIRHNERFMIERIEVRDAQYFSPDLLIAETLLRVGTMVSRDDLQAAVRRLARLPFVFEADYMLQEASGGDKRVVVLLVRENRPFWFLVDGRFIQKHDPIDAIDYDFPDRTADWKYAAAGARWLFRDGGFAHFGMTVLRNRRTFGKTYSAYELGYTRHRILGTPLFATVIVRSPVDSLEEKTFTPEVVIGFPLTATQTITLEAEDTLFRDDVFRIQGNDFRQLQAERNLSASWTLDTRDEPFTTMQGTFVRVEPYMWMAERTSFRSRPVPGPPPMIVTEPSADHTTSVGIDVTTERHWKLSSEVSSFSAGLSGGWASVDQRQNPAVRSADLRWQMTYEVIQGGYARKIGFLGGSHVELEGRVVLRQVSGEDGDVLGPGFNRTSYEASASWAKRSPRGVLRIGIAFTD